MQYVSLHLQQSLSNFRGLRNQTPRSLVPPSDRIRFQVKARALATGTPTAAQQSCRFDGVIDDSGDPVVGCGGDDRCGSWLVSSSRASLDDEGEVSKQTHCESRVFLVTPEVGSHEEFFTKTLARSLDKQNV